MITAPQIDVIFRGKLNWSVQELIAVLPVFETMISPTNPLFQSLASMYWTLA